MENKNITYNLAIKQTNQSNALAYNKDYVAANIDTSFGILDNAYKETGKLYAKLKTAIDSGKCISENCDYEHKQLQRLKNAPQKSLDFIKSVVDQLSVTEEQYYDVNNDYSFMVANCIMTNKPGFSKTEGYNVYLTLIDDGSQQLVFEGPMFEKPLPNASISDEFVLKNSDGSYDYEIIDIGMGKGRNILKFDLDKIKRKAKPFINAEVAGLMQQEQEVIAAWNVFIAKGSSVEEDDQMMQNANAGSLAWSYEKDLPLSQDKKIQFENNYTNYFMNNYLNQFTTNKLPTVEEDAAVFDLEEAKKAKADKFLQDNKLS